MGHLAKYNPQPPPHGHAQAFNCTPSVNTQTYTLSPPLLLTVQKSHLQSCHTAATRSLVPQHTINTLVSVILLSSQFIQA